jgi:hypothetical protein
MGCSNGPIEAVNLLVKKVKPVGHGFRNFDNYRLRLLLHCGVRWQTHRTARLRGRSLRLVASNRLTGEPVLATMAVARLAAVLAHPQGAGHP